MTQQVNHFGLCRLPWMTFLMIKNESANPLGISLLGGNTIVLESDDCSDFIQQSGIARVNGVR